MSHRSNKMKCSLAFLFIAVLTVQLSTLHSHGQETSAGKTRPAQWPPDKIAAERWLRHELATQQTDQQTALLTAPEETSQDSNDISVLQAEGVITRPPNPFDLNGRALQFTPSGNGYTITNTALAYDSNVGAKLNLTAAPAVNPKGGVAEPGDDAYIQQELGFSFTFYGATYTSVSITSNGNLVFRPPTVGQAQQDAFDQSAIAHESLLELRSGPPRLAPYWHDLDARASATQGASGIYLRREADRVIVSWHNLKDFPLEPSDKGTQRFQVQLYRDGRIIFVYGAVELTSKALVGIAPGASIISPTLVNLSNPGGAAFSNACAEFFTLDPGIDEFAVAKTFYQTHPNRDVYDFLYVMTDFYYDLSGASAYYLPVRNEVRGTGQNVFDNDPNFALGSRRLQGIVSLSNINALYPESPTARIGSAYHTLGLLAQEQGRRWLASARYPGGEPKLLLGSDEANWNFFFNTEASWSTPAARRSSVMGGNVWQELNSTSLVSVSLADGYSRLDHYLMGLRPANQIPDSFVLTAATNNFGRDRTSPTRPGVIVSGTKQNVTGNDIVQANNARSPDAATAQKRFRAAFVLIVKKGAQPSPDTLKKITRLRYAWESYFAQSTDFLAGINTGLSEQTVSRVIAASSAASFQTALAPGAIATLFGADLASSTVKASSQPLPTTLAGTQVLVDGVAAPLFFVSPSQINFQVPRGTSATTISPGTQSATALIEVIKDGQLVRAGAFQIGPTAPAVFTSAANGAGPAAAVDAFTGRPAPFSTKSADGQPNIISVFCTGLGADATDVEGNARSSLRVTIGGLQAAVQYAGRAPGFTGLNQLNVQLPNNIAAGTQTMIVYRNGIPSAPVTITLR